MGKTCVFLIACVVAVNAAVIPDTTESGFAGCLEKGSISCFQIELFRTMKSLFEQKSLNLIGGFSLVKNVDESRSAKSLEFEKEIEGSIDIETREAALESYAVDGAVDFMQGRSLHWDPNSMVDSVTSTARVLAESLPTGVSDTITELMDEGRSKRKKLIRSLLPFLVGIKLKLGAALVLAALGVAVLAKKAILASIVSIAISLFIGLKKLLSAKHHHHHPHHHEVAHVGPWASPVVGGGYSNVGSFSSPVATFEAGTGGWDASADVYGSHSSPVAHTIAFNGQKPKQR